MAITKCTSCKGKKGAKVLVKNWGGRRHGYEFRPCGMCKGKGHLKVRPGRGLRW